MGVSPKLFSKLNRFQRTLNQLIKKQYLNLASLAYENYYYDQTHFINPWQWQEQFGFVQANQIREAKNFLFCAGQTSVDREGNPVHLGDMAGQINQALDNLETILEQAGLQLANVVQLKYYTTDVVAFANAGRILGERLAKAKCRPASTLLGVSALFHPDIIVEIEAIAVS